MTEIIIKDKITNKQGSPFNGAIKLLKTDNTKSKNLQLVKVQNGEFSCIVETGTYGIQYLPEGIEKPFVIQETWRIPKSGDSNKAIVYQITDVLKNNRNYSNSQENYKDKDYERLKFDITKTKASLDNLYQGFLQIKDNTQLEEQVDSLLKEIQSVKEYKKQINQDFNNLDNKVDSLREEILENNTQSDRIIEIIENRIALAETGFINHPKLENLYSKIDSFETKILSLSEEQVSIRETNKRLDSVETTAKETNDNITLRQNTIDSDYNDLKEDYDNLKALLDELYGKTSIIQEDLTSEKSQRKQDIEEVAKQISAATEVSESLDIGAIWEAINSLRVEEIQRQQDNEEFIEYVETQLAKNSRNSDDDLISRLKNLEEKLDSLTEDQVNVREVSKRLDSTERKAKTIDSVKKYDKETRKKIEEETQLRNEQIKSLKELVKNLDIPKDATDDIQELNSKLKKTQDIVQGLQESRTVSEEVPQEKDDFDSFVNYVENQLASSANNQKDEIKKLNQRIGSIANRATSLTERNDSIRDINQRLDDLEQKIKNINNFS